MIVMEMVFVTMMEFVNVKLDGVVLIVMSNIVLILLLTIKFVLVMDNVENKLISNVCVMTVGLVFYALNLIAK